MNPKAASPHKCPQVGRTVKRRAQLGGCPSGGGMLPGIRLPASDAIPGRGVACQSVPFHVQDGRRVSSLHLSHRASRGVTAAVQVETACPGLRLGNVLFALQKTQVCPGDPDSGWRWGRERGLRSRILPGSCPDFLSWRKSPPTGACRCAGPAQSLLLHQPTGASCAPGRTGQSRLRPVLQRQLSPLRVAVWAHVSAPTDGVQSLHAPFSLYISWSHPATRGPSASGAAPDLPPGHKANVAPPS